MADFTWLLNLAKFLHSCKLYRREDAREEDARGRRKLLRLSQVDLGIVADIQATGLTLDLGIAADQGMGQDDIVEVGKGADDGIFNNGVIDAGLFTDSHIGANDRVTDIATGSDAYRLNDNSILELVLRGDGPAELFEELGIGFQQGFLFPAIEPVLYFEGMEFRAVADHAFDGIGEVVFAVAGDLVTDIILQAVEKGAGLLDAVDPYQGHIGFGDLGLLHYPFDTVIVFQLGHPEITGVIHPFYPQQGAWVIQDFLYIVFADGIPQNDKYLVFPYDPPGKEYRMPDAMPFVLDDEMDGELGIFLFDKILDLFAEIADDENKLMDTGLH